MIKIVSGEIAYFALLIISATAFLSSAVTTVCLGIISWAVFFPILILICKFEWPSAALTIFLFNILQMGFLLYKEMVHDRIKEYESRLSAVSEIKSVLSRDLERLSLKEESISRDEHEIVNLYEITKKMSEHLKFDDMFDEFSEFFKENFAFRRCDLLMIAQDGGDMRVDKRYVIWHDTAEHSVEQDSSYDRLMKMSSDNPRVMFISMEENGELFKELAAGNGEIVSFCATGLSSGKKTVGVLVIQNLQKTDIEKFIILAAQFALEIRKVLLYEMVERLAITDSLTGLYVRRYFSERAGEELQRSKKHKLKFAFLMIDIDDFKKCNDRYGHLVGDVVLSELARIMKESVREIDLVSRYGGEEFAIVLPETGMENAGAVAQRLRKRIEGNVFRAYDEKLDITISIGISIYAGDNDKLASIVERADEALYNAKKSGKNVVCEYKKRYNNQL